MCRSRRELSNEYLLAKIGVDTAENEPLEVWGENSIHYSLHSLGRHPRAPRAAPAQRARPLGGLRGALDEPPRAPGGRAGGGGEGAPAGRGGGAEPRRSGVGAAGA